MKALVSDIDHTLVFDGRIKEDDEKAIKNIKKIIYLACVQADRYVL